MPARSVIVIMVLSLPAALAGQDAAIDSLFLRAGDAIRIELPDRPALAGTFQVGHDGAVLLPLLGFVGAEDRPFADVREEITVRYRGELDDSAFRVTPLIRIRVLGQVNRPGLVMVDPSDRMGAVFDQADGLTGLADRGRIRLVRGGEVIARLDPESRPVDFRFQPGDQIVVGRISWIREHGNAFIQALGSVAAAAVVGLIFR